MKKCLGIVVALMGAVTFSAFTGSDPTVTDTVGVAYDAGDKIALLGIDTSGVDLVWSNSYTAETAGAQPANTSGATAAGGSSLRYTLYGYSSAKITASANGHDSLVMVAVTEIKAGTTSTKEGTTVIADLGVMKSNY